MILGEYVQRDNKSKPKNMIIQLELIKIAKRIKDMKMIYVFVFSNLFNIEKKLSFPKSRRCGNQGPFSLDTLIQHSG